MYSAGPLMSTVEGMFKYYQALNSYKLVSKETCTSYKLVDGSITGYGYGVEVRNIFGYPSVYHAGGGAGFLRFKCSFHKRF